MSKKNYSESDRLLKMLWGQALSLKAHHGGNHKWNHLINEEVPDYLMRKGLIRDESKGK